MNGKRYKSTDSLQVTVYKLKAMHMVQTVRNVYQLKKPITLISARQPEYSQAAIGWLLCVSG